MVHFSTILRANCRRFLGALAIFLMALLQAIGISPAHAQEMAQTPSASSLLKNQDIRLAVIAEKMLLANADFCAAQMPLTGMILHSRDQYPDGTELGFFGGKIGVSAILANSPADRAGLKEGDTLISVGGADLGAITHKGEEPFRDAVFDMLAQSPAGTLIQIEVMRDGNVHKAQIAAPTGCLSLVEILAEDALAARSDGRVIQVSYGLASITNDDQLAVVFAHEFAHLVLEHRRRLKAAGISKGLLGELGKNQKLNRQVEVEADRMSAHLLANAGYDPRIASGFWVSTIGKRISGGMMRSWAYPSASARQIIIQTEIDQYIPLGTGPTIPGHLLARKKLEF